MTDGDGGWPVTPIATSSRRLPALDGTTSLNTSAFMFDPALDFFGQEQRTSPVNEGPSWALSWTPAELSSEEYDTPSASSSTYTFFTPSKPIDIPPPMTSKQRAEGKSRRGGFFRAIRLTLPWQSDPPLHKSALAMAEVVSYGDTSGLSPAWIGRRRFGGRLTSRKQKNWLLFAPGKLLGNNVIG